MKLRTQQIKVKALPDGWSDVTAKIEHSKTQQGAKKVYDISFKVKSRRDWKIRAAAKLAFRSAPHPKQD